MTTGSWTQTNYIGQTGTTYPLQIDANFAVSQRFVDNFAPRAQPSPNMTVLIDAGHLFSPGTNTLTEIGAQTSATFTAPISLPRIDRIVADESTGVISVVHGTENASPVAPTLPAGKMPICQVALQTSTTAISGSIITDERALWGIGTGGGFQTQVTVAAATTTDLGASLSNNIFVSGTSGTISSFGSSASIAAPIYIVTFAGGVTIANSAHLIMPGNSNQITANNDSLLANYLGSGNWQVLAYFSAVQSAVPTGSIFPYAGTAAPSGFAIAAGQPIAVASFPNLFSVIGYIYGGSGATFFVPDLRARVPVGFDAGNSTGQMTGALTGGISAAALGNHGGRENHTLSIPEMPAHTHTQTNAGVISAATGGVYGLTAAVPGGAQTGSSGGGAAHNVVQPGLVLNYIIKL